MEFKAIKYIEIYESSTYKVAIHEKPNKSYGHFPPIKLLSVSRKDGKRMTWDEIQKVKDNLMGEEYEGVMIFPPKKQIVNGSNAYHLWIFVDPEYRLPFGFRR